MNLCALSICSIKRCMYHVISESYRAYPLRINAWYNHAESKG